MKYVKEHRQAIILVALAVFIVVEIIVFGVLDFGDKDDSEQLPGAPGTLEDSEEVLTEAEDIGFSPDVPEEIELSETKGEAPASANPELDTKIRFFDLTASVDGFKPQSLVVNKGDTLRVDFSAIDGDYDLDIPYLGAYFSVVREGKIRQLPFDATHVGTFTFSCRDFCPASGKIYGQLIVKPME